MQAPKLPEIGVEGEGINRVNNVVGFREFDTGIGRKRFDRVGNGQPGRKPPMVDTKSREDLLLGGPQTPADCPGPGCGHPGTKGEQDLTGSKSRVAPPLSGRAGIQIGCVRIGGPIGVRTLVENYRVSYSGGPRGYIALMEQITYIEDYDVQIATASTIADPVIGLLQTGTVVDAQTLRITEYVTLVERSVIWHALQKIGGGDGEAQPKSLEEFNKWWKKSQRLYE